MKLGTPSRIMLNIGLSGKKFNFLYNPGSNYSIITKKTYDNLTNRPTINKIGKIGMSVQNIPFEIMGVIFITIRLHDLNGITFDLKDEPVFVSKAIDTNIFGISTEERFRSVKRDNEQLRMTFTTKGGADVIVKFFRERQIWSSFVQVSSTSMVEQGGRKQETTKDDEGEKEDTETYVLIG